MSEQEAVLAANRAFYAAFSTRDMAAMEAVWARTASVTCVHPGWAVLFGRADVLASWRRIFGDPDAPDVRLRNARAHMFDDLAYVVCVEDIGGASLVATNIFAPEDGAWKLVHHQAGLMADLSEAPPEPGSGTLH